MPKNDENSKYARQVGAISPSKVDSFIRSKNYETRKGVTDVTQSANTVLNKIGHAVDSLTSSIRSLTVSSLRATKNVVSDFNKTMREELIGTRENIITMSLSTISPLLGVATGKLFETPAMRKILGNIKNKLPFSRKSYGIEDYDNYIPKMQRGGYVRKGGYAKLHSAEVVMPSSDVSEMNENISDMRDSLGSISNTIEQMSMTIEKTMGSFEKISNFVTAPWRFLYGVRGSYVRYLSKEPNVFANMRSTLQTTFLFQTARLDAIRGYTKETVLSLRDLVTFFTGKRFSKLQEEREMGWTMMGQLKRFKAAFTAAKRPGTTGIGNRLMSMLGFPFRVHEEFGKRKPEEVDPDKMADMWLDKFWEHIGMIFTGRKKAAGPPSENGLPTLGSILTLKDVLQDCCKTSNKNANINNEQVKQQVQETQKVEGILVVQTKKLEKIKETIKEDSTSEKKETKKRSGIFGKVVDYLKGIKQEVSKKNWLDILFGIGGFFLKMFSPGSLFTGAVGAFLATQVASLFGVGSPLVTALGGALGASLASSGMLGTFGAILVGITGLAITVYEIYKGLDSFWTWWYKSKDVKRQDEIKKKGYTAGVIPAKDIQKARVEYAELEKRKAKLMAMPVYAIGRDIGLEKIEKKEKPLKKLIDEEKAGFKVLGDLKKVMSTGAYSLLQMSLPDSNPLAAGGTLRYLQEEDLLIFDKTKKQWMTQDEFIQTLPTEKLVDYQKDLWKKKLERIKKRVGESPLTKSAEQALQSIGQKTSTGYDWAKRKISGINISTLVNSASRITGVSSSLINRIIQAESSGDPNALGKPVRVGGRVEQAVGLMQLLPSTAADLGVNPYDPLQNVLGGSLYLKQMLNRFGGDERLTVQAYHQGPNAVAAGLLPGSQTSNYTRKVTGELPKGPIISKEQTAKITASESMKQAMRMASMSEKVSGSLEEQARATNNMASSVNNATNVIMNNNLTNSNNVSNASAGNIFDPSSANVSSGMIGG